MTIKFCDAESITLAVSKKGYGDGYGNGYGYGNGDGNGDGNG